MRQQIEHKINVADLMSILSDIWGNKHTSEKIFALRSELYEAVGNVDFFNISLK